MAPPDQGSGATPTPEAASAAALKTSTEEPMAQQHHHERALSGNTSFSSPTATSSPALSYASSSTNYLPASNKLSCESIPYAGFGPVDDLVKLSSFSSSSSYESFYHIEAEALDDDSDCGDVAVAAAAAGNNEFQDFEPCTTRPPSVQTMMPQKSRQRAEGGAAAAAYDPKRLPSSMFRTRSTNPAEWSASSNESLFSIQSSAGDLNAGYADFYYDAAGFPRFSSLGRERDAAALKQLPSLSESSGRSGGLCVRHDCARCGSGSKTRKSVRFAATESVVSGEGKHSVVVSTLAVEMEETEAPAASPATKEAPAAGWCELGCCLGSSSPTSWWPRCCGGHGCGCHCKWWF